MFFQNVRSHVAATSAALPVQDPLRAGVCALDPFAAPPRNIMQTLFGARNHATLAAALEAAEMAEGLEGRGPFTLFAPSNAAFGRYPAGLIPGLMTREARARLAKVLGAHLVAGLFEVRDLLTLIDHAGGRARLATLGGGRLSLSLAQGAVCLTTEVGAKAMIIGPDRYQTNGLIHAINAVLAP